MVWGTHIPESKALTAPWLVEGWRGRQRVNESGMSEWRWRRREIKGQWSQDTWRDTGFGGGAEKLDFGPVKPEPPI